MLRASSFGIGVTYGVGDRLFVMFQPSPPFQSDNAMAVVEACHNNLVTWISLTPTRIPYVSSVSRIQPS